MQFKGGFSKLCAPFFQMETDPNITVITVNPTTEATEPEPQPEPEIIATEIPEAIQTGMEIGQQLGEQSAELESMKTQLAEAIAAAEAARMETQFLQTEMLVLAQTIEEMKQPPESENTLDEIPAIPEPEQMEMQLEPEPEKSKFWNLKNWL